jgi:hypothetical protein
LDAAPNGRIELAELAPSRRREPDDDVTRGQDRP